MFDESFSSALSYTSRPYAEAMAMRQAVPGGNMAWKISLLQKLWTNWTCSSPDSGKLTNLAGGIWKEYQQMQVRSLPRQSSKRNVKLAELV